MKTFWKVLGAAAVVASLTPYHYNKNEETGEQSLQALLWKLSSKPDPEQENKSAVELSFGLNLPTPCRNAVEDIFSDDLTVTYHTVPANQCTCDCDCACEGECGDDYNCGENCCCDSKTADEEPCCEEGPCCEECCKGCCDETAAPQADQDQ